MSKTTQEVRNFCWPDGTSWWSVFWVFVLTVLGPSYKIIRRTTTWSTVTFLSRVSLSQFSEPLPSSWGPHGTCAMFRGRAWQVDLGETPWLPWNHHPEYQCLQHPSLQFTDSSPCLLLSFNNCSHNSYLEKLISDIGIWTVLEESHSLEDVCLKF